MKAIKSKTVQFLRYLLEVMEEVGDLAFDKNAVYKYAYGHTFPKKEITRYLGNMKNRGYLEIRDYNANETIQFTNKAKMKLIDIIAAKRNSEKRFNFVSFDVPEDMRNERDKFRLLIKRLGFVQIQRSLWVSNKNVGDLVEMAVYECGIEKYVVYIISEHTDIDGVIEKMLKNK